MCPLAQKLCFKKVIVNAHEDIILNKLIIVLFQVIFKELEIMQISNNRGIKLKNLALCKYI